MTRFAVRDPDWWSRAILVVASLGAAVTAFYVIRLIATTFMDAQVIHEAMEPAALFSARAIGDGGLAAAYPADWMAAEHPLILTPYPPFFHLLWLGATMVLGGEWSYFAGRVIADVALVGIVLAIYGCARTQGVSRMTALPFALIFLTPIPVANWAGVARVDIPAISLTLLGFLIYLRTADSEGRKYLYAAIPFILAGLTKQNVIAAPGAVIFAELARRRYDRAGLLALVTGGGTLGVFLLLNVASGGGFFNATINSLAEEIFFIAGIGLAFDFLLSGPTLVAISALAVSPLILRRVQQPAILLYLAMNLFVLAMTIGKPGSNVNYYLEPIAALCIAAAVGFQALRERSVRVQLVAAAALAICVVWSAVQYIPQYKIRYVTKRFVIANQQRGYALSPDIAAGPVIAPPGFYLLFDEPRPTIYTNDLYTFGAMAAWGKLFDAQRVIDDFRSHRIKAVLIGSRMLDDTDHLFIGDWRRGWNFWSVPGFKEALLESYELAGETPMGLLLFMPRAAGVDESVQ